jgi:hypothetical protein
MSNNIFKSIVSSIEFYETRVLTPDNIRLAMFPHLKDLTIAKIEILRKLIELIGDKEDKYYEEFYNNNLKEFDLINKYTFDGGLTKFNNFKDINDFMNKIKNYEWNDGNLLMNEIKTLLNKEIPNKKIKETKAKTKKKPISATMKKLVWNTNIGESIGKAKCLCCNSTDITQLSFNCGHIVAEANGGDTIVSNLKPICQNCNSSMGTKNMEEFMKTLK